MGVYFYISVVSCTTLMMLLLVIYLMHLDKVKLKLKLEAANNAVSELGAELRKVRRSNQLLKAQGWEPK